MEIRPVDPSTADYEGMAALWNDLFPDMPRHGDIWRHRDTNPHPGIEPWGGFVAMNGDSLRGIGYFTGCPTAGVDGQLQYTYAVPDGPDAAAVLDALHEALDEEVASHAPPVVVGSARDTHPWMVAFYERHGFDVVQETASSTLRRPDFAAHAGAEARERLAIAGCRVTSAAELAKDGDAWLRPYHALESALVGDIPFDGPVRERPFEEFTERVVDPDRFNPNAAFVAQHERTGAYVGIGQLWTYTHIPDYAFAGLTGVLPAFRRRGIARALKLATIDFAASHGIERITAQNEVDNPMLQLNLALGFEIDHVQRTMSKRMS